MNKVKKILKSPFIWLCVLSIINVLIFGIEFRECIGLLSYIGILVSAIIITIGIFHNPLKERARGGDMK